LRAAERKSSAAHAVSGQVAAEIGFVDQSLALGRIPWETVFRDIEGAKAPEIVLLGLNLRGGRREVHIIGEAPDFAALSAYMAGLGSRAGLADVRLLGHQPLAKGSSAAIRFELALHWRAD
jgi:Tfp pilus assembly protein PilN